MTFHRDQATNFFHALSEGIFTIPLDTASQAPVGYLLLIDNDTDYITDNSLQYLIAPDV